MFADNVDAENAKPFDKCGKAQCRSDEVSRAVKSTKRVARRELAAIQHYTDLDIIENGDEVCLGICMTIWLAFAIWVGTVIVFRLASQISGLANHISFGHGIGLETPREISMLDVRSKMEGLSPKEVFAECIDKYGSLDADVACFAPAMEGVLGDRKKANFVFMKLDCNNDFRIDDSEFSAAWNSKEWACGQTAQQQVPTAGPLTPVTVATTTTTTTATATHYNVPEAWGARGDMHTYLVDNSKLNADSLGLAKRASKHFEDLRGGLADIVEWGNDVRGKEAGDGWLKVDDWYLPLKAKGVPVLVRCVHVLLALKAVPGVDGTAPGGEAASNLGHTVRQELLAASGPGYTADRVRVEAPTVLADGALQVVASVVLADSDAADSLHARLASGDAACHALAARFADGDKYSVAACQVGSDGPLTPPAPKKFPRPEESDSGDRRSPPSAREGDTDTPVHHGGDDQLGLITLDRYMKLLGTGASVAVQLVIQRIGLDEFKTSEDVAALKAEIVQLLAGAVGIEHQSVLDVQGNEASVSFSSQQGDAASKFLLVNCRLRLAFGQTVSAVAEGLSSSETRQNMAVAMRPFLAGHSNFAGSTLSKDDFKLGIAVSRDDIFFLSDSDFDNRLGPAEFGRVALTRFSVPMQPEDSDSIFTALDLNGDKLLSDEEFFASSRMAARA